MPKAKKEPQKDRRALVVLGMHRSGTSAVTRVLNLCGATLPETLMSPKDDNPAGFWESDRLYQFSEEVLKSAGSRWDDIGGFPASWFDSDLMPVYRDRLGQLLIEEFGTAPMMVIKDPRACRLVPLFDATLLDLNAAPNYIIPVRSPLEVAASLRARDGFSSARGTLLWLRHVLEAELATRDKDRIFVAYEDLLTDWKSVIGKIGDEFSIEWPTINAGTDKEIGKFLNRNLKHQHTPEDALASRPDVASRVKAVFGELMRAANGKAIDHKVLDDARDWLRDAANLFVPIIKEHELQLEELGRDQIRLEQLGSTTELLEKELEDIRQDRELVVTRSGQLEHDLNALKDEYDNTRRWAQELKQDAERAGESRAQAEARNETLQLELKALEEEQAKSKEWAENLNLELKAARQEYEHLEARSEVLNQQLQSQQAEQEKSRQWVEALKQEIDDRDSARRQLEADIREAHFGRELAEEQADLLRQNIQTHQRVADELSAHLETQRQSSEKSAREIERQKQAVSDLSAALDSRRAETDSQIREVSEFAESLEQELAAQKFAFDQTEDYARSLERELEAQRSAREAAETELASIRKSTSWLISAPVRGIGHTLRFILSAIKRSLYLVARTVFRLTPMPARTRWAIRQRLHGPTEEPRVPVETENMPKAIQTAQLDPKTAHREQAKARLNEFLASADSLVFQMPEHPRVSVILILYNQAELTLACLQALHSMTRDDIEVIIWDNASSDQTRELLDRIEGTRTILNEENLHFLLGCNAAVKEATGEYLLFLNNDAELMPGALDAALDVFDQEARVGAVGGKVILLDGTLQEAGNIIWSDGSCLGYGRGDDPNAPMYSFRRDVDYVSGVFMLTPRSLFNRLGGFNEALAPAYYEETDYCMRLWAEGYRVVYQPDASITHFEYGSSSGESATELMVRNQSIFRETHQSALQNRHLQPEPSHILQARTHHNKAPSVLYIDDMFPHLDLGQGFPRSNFLLSALTDQNAEVTLFATNQTMEAPASLYRDISPRVECFCGSRDQDLRHLLNERVGHYDYIFVSRPHNMVGLQYALEDAPHIRDRTVIIYDAEALFCSREIAWHELQGQPLTEKRINKLIRSEVALADTADVIVTVSEAEKDHFVDHVTADIAVIGHAMNPRPGKSGFDERQDFVFIGAMPNDNNPNADSMQWFISQVWPEVRSALSSVSPRLRVVGLNESPAIHALAADDVLIEGRVEDLSAVYDAARVIVIPTRYAAGIPYKGHEAAQFGVPMVTTSLIAGQLQWQHDKELLAADHRDPAAFTACCVRLYQDRDVWERIRRNSLEALERDCSPASQITKIELLFDIATSEKTASAVT